MTSTGIVVTFRRIPLWMPRLFPFGDAAGIILFVPYMIRLAIYFITLMEPVRIEITREAVIVRRKKMRRIDFGYFYISRTKHVSSLSTSSFVARKDDDDGLYAVVGYTYARQRYEIPYYWIKEDAEHFLAALNQDLRGFPMAGDHNQSPDELRTAGRPSEF